MRDYKSLLIGNAQSNWDFMLTLGDAIAEDLKAMPDEKGWTAKKGFIIKVLLDGLDNGEMLTMRHALNVHVAASKVEKVKRVGSYNRIAPHLGYLVHPLVSAKEAEMIFKRHFKTLYKAAPDAPDAPDVA